MNQNAYNFLAVIFIGTIFTLDENYKATIVALINGLNNRGESESPCFTQELT